MNNDGGMSWSDDGENGKNRDVAFFEEKLYLEINCLI